MTHNLNLDVSTRCREILHNEVYNNQEGLNNFINRLNNFINPELFQFVEYCQYTRTMIYKVKLTNIKKQFGASYSHNSFFYNELLMPSIYNAIESEPKIIEFLNVSNSYGFPLSSYINSMYNIMAISNNLVYINL